MIGKMSFSNLSVCVGVQYKTILVEKKGANQNVGLITLNRPKALNALCAELMNETAEALQNFQNDKDIGAIVLTGSEKAFAGELEFLSIEYEFSN